MYLDGKVYVGGKLLEVITMKKHPLNLVGFKRLKGGQYSDSHGNIRSYSHVRPGESKARGGKTFSSLRRIINANFSWDRSEVHVVLTYGNPQRDDKQLSKDVKAFWRRVCRRYQNLEYVTIMDQHKNGSWHCHMLVKDTTGNDLYIEREGLEALWGHGFVYVYSLDGKTETAWYFYKKHFETQKATCYPSSFKIYRCSKGIIRPKGENKTREEICDMLAEGYRIKDEYTYSVIAEDELGHEVEVNAINHHEYVRG